MAKRLPERLRGCLSRHRLGVSAHPEPSRDAGGRPGRLAGDAQGRPQARRPGRACPMSPARPSRRAERCGCERSWWGLAALDASTSLRLEPGDMGVEAWPTWEALPSRGRWRLDGLAGARPLPRGGRTGAARAKGPNADAHATAAGCPLRGQPDSDPPLCRQRPARCDDRSRRALHRPARGPRSWAAGARRWRSSPNGRRPPRRCAPAASQVTEIPSGNEDPGGEGKAFLARRDCPATRREEACDHWRGDLLAVAGPRAPAFELAGQAGAELDFAPDRGFAVKVDAAGRTSVPWLLAVGSCSSA